MLEPLAVIVPAKDEELRLPLLLDALAGADDLLAAAGFELSEVIVVDDHSDDGTAAVVTARAAVDPRLRLLRSQGGSGKGAAVRTGMLAATAPWALLTDADLATPLRELASLARSTAAGGDIAIGSRGLPASTILRHQPRHREFAGKTFNRMVRLLTGLPYRDTQCGFKLFRLATTRSLFEGQRTNGFAFDVELLVAARRRGLRVEEIPVLWSDEPQTRVRLGGASLSMALELFRIAVADRRRRRHDPHSERSAARPSRS